MSPHATPDTMRALVLSGTGFHRLALKTVPTPRPGPSQLLARVDAAGICTSLVKIVEQGPRHTLIHGWDLERFPIILGDEGAITLVAVGEALRDRFAPGERYVAQPAVDQRPINHRERFPHEGRDVERLGIGYTLPGHLAEYMLVPEEVIEAGCLLPIERDDFPSSHAAMSEPFSCALAGQEHHLRLSQPDPNAPRQAVKGLRSGGVTVVVGAGAMGRMHVDLALAARPRSIVAIDFLRDRLAKVVELFGERAAALGVEMVTVDAGAEDPVEAVLAHTERRGADDVIVAVGAREPVEMAQRLVATGGVLNIFGGLKKGEDVVAIDSGIVHYRSVHVTGSSGGSPWDVARILELMHAGEVDAGAHIARVGDLDHALEFLDLVRRRALDGKAVVYPHRRASRALEVTSWSADDERRWLASRED